MISISFEKWHGCKNDFIVIQGKKPENQYLLNSLQRQAPLLCSKTGEGECYSEITAEEGERGWY